MQREIEDLKEKIFMCLEEYMSSLFSTMSNTNWAVRLKKMARGLKFQI